ncbi:MAG: hypothetical protein IH830_04715 [Planctomycetes bacterium]|nr:hypothetical protein [Planctomycetota bacterium]
MCASLWDSHRTRVNRIGSCTRFRSRRKVIFVHGCFWHRHTCRKGRSLPSTRRRFWADKLGGNRQRDLKNQRALRRQGWGVLTVWECQISQPDRLVSRIGRFLGP